MRLDAAVGRECFIFELGVVDKLGLVHEKPRERERVRRAGPILGYDNSHAAVIERYDVFIIVRRRDGLAKRFGRLLADHIVYALDEAPSLPRGEQPRNCVSQSVLD